MRHPLRRLSLLLLPLLTACGGGDVAPPFPPRTAGTPLAPAHDEDRDGASDVVEGWRGWVTVDEAGLERRSGYGLPLESVSALVPRPDGRGYALVLAADVPGSRFRIEGVPTPYLLKVDQDYFWTESRELDLGHSLMGHADYRNAPEGTSLALELSGLSPYAYGDELTFCAFNAGAGGYSLSTLMAPPQPGATSVSGAFAWGRSDPLWTRTFDLIQPDKGDRVYVAQHVRRRVSAQLALGELRRAFATSGFGMAAGTRSTLFGTLAPLPLTRRELELRLSEHRAAALESSERAEASLFSLVLAATPRGPSTTGFWTETGELVRASGWSTLPDQHVTAEYGNPYPARWMTAAHLDVAAETRLLLPRTDGTELPFRTFTSVRTRIVPGDDGPLVFALRVSPPRALSIEGRPAQHAPLDGVGPTPLLAWSAPARGSATYYRVVLRELYEEDGAARAKDVARFYTPLTSVRLPGYLLLPGHHYYFTVDAVQSEAWDVRRPFLTAGDFEGRATAISERFTR